MERVGRRQLHTITSRETIKPLSPTPSHLHTYNLSEMNLLNPKLYIPLILFYPNNGDSSEQKAMLLKKSLSQSLTRYYPFAGRLPTPTSTYVDCNDAGVLFVEAKIDDQMETFQRMSGDDETLDHLFADDLVCYKNPSSTNLVGIQLNHFACGGLGLAVSLSHVIGDGSALGSFLSHWAFVARYGSTNHPQVLALDPHFLRSPRTHSTELGFEETMIKKKINLKKNMVSRRFIFTNSKLNDLKNKVASIASGSINNPTRVEVLTSLLYKTALDAATAKSGTFGPSYLFFMVNVREKFAHKLPQTTVGNFVNMPMVKTEHARETSLSTLIREIRKKKTQLEGIQSVQQLAECTKASLARLGSGELENLKKGAYYFSSFCGFPMNKLDFGWGTPTGTTLVVRKRDDNVFFLTDTTNGDGIEVLAILEEDVMELFEKDKEMLSYYQN